MVTIRPYCEPDAETVGCLIADTYSRFNLSFASAEELAKLLGPFRHAVAGAGSPPGHRGGYPRTTGPRRGRGRCNRGSVARPPERLASLFVRGDHHRRGIGRALVERFEQESSGQGVSVIRLAAALYAIPFYTALGYQRRPECAMAGVSRGRA